MKVVSLLNWYLAANVLVSLAALQLYGMVAGNRLLPRPIRFRHLLPIAYALTMAAVMLPAFDLGVESNLWPQTAQVWASDSTLTVAESPNASTAAVRLTAAQRSLPLNDVAGIASLVVVLGIAIVLAQLLRDCIATARIIRGANIVRRSGRALVVTSDATTVPFSYWTPRHAWIVMPSSLLARSRELRIALQHEVQHHRQGDTKSVYIYQALRGIFFWNPFMHLLVRQVRNLQELVCDEAVTDAERSSRQEYCNCLLSVAAGSLNEPTLLQARMAGGSTLAQRIDAILRRPIRHASSTIAVSLSTIAVCVLAGATFALGAPIEDQRITLAEAQWLARNTNARSAFPIVVNDAVVHELNRMVGTPDGRVALQAAMTRMHAHRDLITRELLHHQLPPELLAVPLVESGYRNLPQDRNPSRGAGLWMFIKPTARHFGLTVDEQRDDRLDVAAETKAAMVMFASLYDRFDDWGLALLAYNSGERRVAQGMRETGSNDVWKLIERGYENDPHYLPRVMAAILIISNPSLTN